MEDEKGKEGQEGSVLGITNSREKGRGREDARRGVRRKRRRVGRVRSDYERGKE